MTMEERKTQIDVYKAFRAIALILSQRDGGAAKVTLTDVVKKDAKNTKTA